MRETLSTYVCDHLAGANFAVSLLEDLEAQAIEPEVSALAAKLLPEIQADRQLLAERVEKLGDGKSPIKEAAGWIAQKASRFKLRLGEPIGVYEAIELLSLGVLGKASLWTALRELPENETPFRRDELDALIDRAEQQHAQLDLLRLKLASIVFATSSEDK